MIRFPQSENQAVACLPKFYRKLSEYKFSLMRQCSLQGLAAASVVIFFITFAPIAEAHQAQRRISKEDETWLRSKAEPLIETLITDLYGSTNPFNLLKKSQPDNHRKVAKRYIGHMNKMVKEFNFLRRDECPPTTGGERQYYCPTQDLEGKWSCITTDQLCDSVTDCPGQEDEDAKLCLFHRPVLAKLDDLSHSITEFERNLLRRVQNFLSSGGQGFDSRHASAPGNSEEIAQRVAIHSRRRMLPPPPSQVDAAGHRHLDPSHEQRTKEHTSDRSPDRTHSLHSDLVEDQNSELSSMVGSPQSHPFFHYPSGGVGRGLGYNLNEGGQGDTEDVDEAQGGDGQESLQEGQASDE